MNREDKLNWNERSELIVEAGIGSIPYVGGALQTLYFGSKNEKRFKRIERFYEELRIEIEKVKEHLPIIHETNYSAEVIGILELINDEVEKASSQSKINNYKKAFKNTLLNFNNDAFDNEKYFVRLLPELTDLELNILFRSSNNPYMKVDRSDFYNQDRSNRQLITGSINRLTDFGLVHVSFGTLIQGPEGAEIKREFSVSEFGLEFIKFIFE